MLVSYSHRYQIILDPQLIRDIKINIVLGKYKAISAYKIPTNPQDWLECPNCHLNPLIWTFNNVSSTSNTLKY